MKKFSSKVLLFLKGILLFPYYITVIYKNSVKNNLLNNIQSYQKFSSYENTKKIEGIKGKYKNKKCFIIGGSPSLNQLDLNKLNKSSFFTFSTGRGYKLKDKGLLHSNFHVFADPNGYEEFFDEMDTEFSDFYFSSSNINFLHNVKDYLYFIPTMKDKISFQMNLLQPLFDAKTVIYFALQIAVFMGFKDIYFIGVDLDFAKQGGHVYKSSKKEMKRQNKFSDKSSGIMLDGLEYAAKFCKEHNINLYNASPAGIVDCMPRVNYDNLF